MLTALFCFLYFIRVLLVRTLTQSQCKGGAWSLWKSGARPPQATPCGSRGWSHAALALGGSLQPQAALGERCPAAGFPKHLHNTKVADHLLLGRSFPQWGRTCLCSRLDVWSKIGLKALRYQILFKEWKLFISLEWAHFYMSWEMWDTFREGFVPCCRSSAVRFSWHDSFLRYKLIHAQDSEVRN